MSKKRKFYCPWCCGIGYLGHADSGEHCEKCNGTGERRSRMADEQQRRSGNSRLVWDKESRTIRREAPPMSKPLPVEVVEALRKAVQALSITTAHYEEVEIDGVMVDPCELLEQLEAALAKLDAPVAAPGWQMVPVEPTPEMIHAGIHHPLVGDTYSSMLAAAPPPPVPAPVQGERWKLPDDDELSLPRAPQPTEEPR